MAGEGHPSERDPPWQPPLAGQTPQRPDATCKLGARLRGRAATQRSKKGSEKGSGEISQKGSGEGACCGFYSLERVLRRVLRRGSEKGVSRRCPERPSESTTP